MNAHSVYNNIKRVLGQHYVCETMFTV